MTPRKDMLKTNGKRVSAFSKVHARSMSAMKPGLMHALRGAVASGDAPAAHEFYRAVAGPAAAAKMAGSDELAKLKGWLSHQP